MVVHASRRHFDDERETDQELVLVAVTYTGSRQQYVDNAVRTQGYWPSYGGFTQDVTKVAFVPDQGLTWFEQHSDFNVEYGREAIAEALLDKNFLAPEVFSTGAGGGEARQRILDHLEIESMPTTEAEIRDRLAEIAGVDDPGEEAMTSLSDELLDEKRSTLKDAAGQLRESTDDISLNSGKTDFAEYLADCVEGGDLSESGLWDVIREVRDD